jgi:hypothetical protein
VHIAKTRTNNRHTDIDLAEEIGPFNPVQWETPIPQNTRRWGLRDLFSAKRRTADLDIKRLCPEEDLEPGRPRPQRELALFFDYMTSAVAKYTEKYVPWRLPDQSEDREELLSRYAVLLNYLEERMGRRFDSPVPNSVGAAA